MRTNTMYLWFGCQCQCCCTNVKSFLLFPLSFKAFTFVSGPFQPSADCSLPIPLYLSDHTLVWFWFSSTYPVREPEEPGRHNPHPLSLHIPGLPPTHVHTHPPTFAQSISTAFVSDLRAPTLVPESTSAPWVSRLVQFYTTVYLFA